MYNVSIISYFKPQTTSFASGREEREHWTHTTIRVFPIALPFNPYTVSSKNMLDKTSTLTTNVILSLDDQLILQFNLCTTSPKFQDHDAILASTSSLHTISKHRNQYHQPLTFCRPVYTLMPLHSRDASPLQSPSMTALFHWNDRFKHQIYSARIDRAFQIDHLCTAASMWLSMFDSASHFPENLQKLYASISFLFLIRMQDAYQSPYFSIGSDFNGNILAVVTAQRHSVNNDLNSRVY